MNALPAPTTASTAAASLESLEPRRLFAVQFTDAIFVDDGGALEIHGGRRSDRIVVSLDRKNPNWLAISINKAVTIISVEDYKSFGVIGNRGNDRIVLDETYGRLPRPRTIVGGDGNDSLYGTFGVDTISGGEGDDYIEAGNGSDSIDGDAGSDTVIAGNGNDSVNGGADEDSLVGGKGRDTLNGDDGGDILIGGDDNDSLIGGPGDDQMYGNSGNDTLFGNDGEDILEDGPGNDLLLAE